MGPVELDRPLDAEALDMIERRLHGKLRAHRISEAFIARHGEDALQQGLAEYSRALKRGDEIVNPGGWVVRTAYRRAIDELRREVHEEENGDAVDAEAIGSGGGSPTEEEALDRIEAERVRRAVPTLSLEQRQALSLSFYEELTTREAAGALGCSEPTFRRRRDAALRVLRERFGIVAPEPDDRWTIEVGLAAWLSLAGARVVPSRGPVDQLLAAAEGLREGVVAASERSRDLLARFLSSGGGDVSAAAGSSLGKTAGACAGALAACALSGVVGPGVGGVDLIGGGERGKPQAPKRATAPARPAPVTPAPDAAREPEIVDRTPQESKPKRSRQEPASTRRTRQANRAVRSQTLESAAGSPESATPAPTPSPEPSRSGPAPSASPTEAAEEQFGLP